MIHRQSNALSLYLTAVYVAHLDEKAGNAYTNDRHNLRGMAGGRSSWITLAGLSAPKEPRARRARMRRALDELVAANLANVAPPGGRNRYERWMLLADDGLGSQYRVPSERDLAAITLPAAFFLKGWHLVLAPGEIAMLLAIMHMHQKLGGSTEDDRRLLVSLPQSVRYRTYGLSGEIYLHAQQLWEFGLLEFNDPMQARRRGKIANKRIVTFTTGESEDNDAQKIESKPPRRVPYQFSPCLPSAFNEDAFTVVRDTLGALSLPYRLDEQGALMSPQELVKSYRSAEVARAYDTRVSRTEIPNR